MKLNKSELIKENRRLKREAKKLLETCVMLKLENARLRVKETLKIDNPTKPTN